MSYDVVIIGSGPGGLTAGAALARAGQKVLVLEQHYVPGGWCHSFPLEGHRFSPGVHYVGELAPGGRLGAIFQGLGMGQDLHFFELNPDAFDHLRVGAERFDVPRGRERLRLRLEERFPRQVGPIRRYLDVVTRMHEELGQAIHLDTTPPPRRRRPGLSSAVLRHGLFSLSRLLRGAGVEDPLLYAFLGAQSGDHGLAPRDVPAAVHASVVGHYFDGGFYPKGGGFALARAWVRALRRAGGELQVRARVARILLERQGGRPRAIGVALADGTEIRAKAVISNADPGVTFGRLLDPGVLSRWLRWRLARLEYSVSALSLFAAADFDADALGLDSGNYWTLADTDVDRAYARFERGGLPAEVDNFFLTITTLKDRTKRKGPHTLEAFTFLPYAAFERWAGTTQGARGSDYEALKSALRARMLAAAERVIPGLAKGLVFADVGTPLTNEHYVAATRGNLYGTRKSALQVGPFGLRVRTEIPGLFLAGASTLGHGVLGAATSGLVAAASILGCRAHELLRAGEAAPTVSRADPERRSLAA